LKNSRNLLKFGFARAAVVFGLSIFCAFAVASSSAQTLTTLASFNSTNGANPYFGPLVQGKNGSFYGTTFNGGANGQGSVFSVSPTGQLTTLYDFCPQTNCVDGANPEAGLILASDGNFYGTTDGGGATGWGTVYSISPSGKFRSVYSFCALSHCTDGSLPTSALVQGTDGSFYGTTFAGGGPLSDGTIFRITPAGKLTTLYRFCSRQFGVVCLDGTMAYAGLVRGKDGNFYGTTYIGGNNDSGTIFRITPTGKFTTVYSFCPEGLPCVDGKNPSAPLTVARNGDLYGTTVDGGAPLGGTIFRFSKGKLTNLYTLCSAANCTDGGLPFGGLVQGSDGNFYGTTQAGGSNRTCSGTCGTIFQITPTGSLSTLYNFCSEAGCSDGNWPYSTLVQGSDGKFYGATYYGGSSSCFFGCGTVFSLSLGLAPEDPSTLRDDEQH
jgi:uncharacterized repeat protein (TIGR03803 family)